MKSACFVAMLIAFSCDAPRSAPVQATQSTQSGAATAGPRATFPDGHVVRLEFATDDETRAQGLMYRDRLGEDQGMLFFFRTTGEYPFWMKDTLISLDMIWLDKSHRIVAIHHRVPPCKADPCPSYAPKANGDYVLEVPGGVAAKHGLVVGSVLRFEGIDNVVVR